MKIIVSSSPDKLSAALRDARGFDTYSATVEAEYGDTLGQAIQAWEALDAALDNVISAVRE